MLLSRLSLLYTRNRRASARGLGDLLHEFQVVASAGRSQECDRFEQFPHGAMLCVFTSQSALPTAPDHCSKDADAFLHDPVGVVHLEIPGSRHRILVISPAEGALVRTGHGGRCFHALVRVDPIESVLVTLALAEDGIPSPAALLHSTVAPHEAIAALGHVLAVLRLHHLRALLELLQLLHRGHFRQIREPSQHQLHDGIVTVLAGPSQRGHAS